MALDVSSHPDQLRPDRHWHRAHLGEFAEHRGGGELPRANRLLANRFANVSMVCVAQRARDVCLAWQSDEAHRQMTYDAMIRPLKHGSSLECALEFSEGIFDSPQFLVLLEKLKR